MASARSFDKDQVCLWGSPGSGKTGFLGCLFNLGGGADGWVISPGGIEGTVAAQTLLDARRGLEEGTINPTPPRSSYEPLTFTLRRSDDGLKHSLPISLTDPAGEFSTDVVRLQGEGRAHLNLLVRGSGIVWLLNAERASDVEFTNLLKQLTLITQEAHSPRVDAPLALCLSRIDTLDEDDQVARRENPEEAVRDHLGPELYALFERIFPTRRCFAISSRGPEEGTINPIGVNDVLTWLWEQRQQRVRTARFQQIPKRLRGLTGIAVLVVVLFGVVSWGLPFILDFFPTGVVNGNPSPLGPQVAASVTLSPTSLTFASLDNTATLTATVEDAGGTVISGATVSWDSSDESLATVSAAGLVTSVATGSSTITTTSGSASGSASVTVTQVAASVTLSPTSLTFASLDNTATLTATVEDAGGTVISGATVSWASSDESLATVSEGLVTSVATGSSTITATSGSASGSASVSSEYSPPPVDPGPCNSTRDGPCQEDWPDGTLQAKGFKQDGELDGNFEIYRQDGTLESWLTYVAGDMRGPFERYDSNGQLVLKGGFEGGQQQGPYELYHSNRQLNEKGVMEGGQWHGPFEKYDSSGQLTDKGTYQNGEECGEWIKDGEPRTFLSCSNDMPGSG